MLTLGVDLAAADERTALAVVEWRAGGARVKRLQAGVGDDEIVEAVREADYAGIDAPFGWPVPFVELVTGSLSPPADGEPTGQWRRKMVYRTTDEVVRAETGLIPLSVSADRIAHAAFRAALLLSRLDPVDRAGDGTVFEMYPAACLHRWGLTHRGYKKGHSFLVDDLLAAATWLVTGPLIRESHDAFDAVIAALGARAAALGHFRRPTGPERPIAAVEGWIALPTCELADLP